MRTVFYGAIALVCTPFLAAAQQSGGVAYPDNWTGGAPLPAVNQTTYQPQTYGSVQPTYRPSDYYAVHNHTQQEQPHLHTYNAPQSVYTPAYAGQTQPVYERRPHHRPDNLAGYWPFISKAHADRDFQNNWIHVYDGGEPTQIVEPQR